jgi:hypothetical protein
LSAARGVAPTVTLLGAFVGAGEGLTGPPGKTARRPHPCSSANLAVAITGTGIHSANLVLIAHEDVLKIHSKPIAVPNR